MNNNNNNNEIYIIEDDNEEIVVNNLSNMIMGVFRDNPWLLDYIKNNINKI